MDSTIFHVSFSKLNRYSSLKTVVPSPSQISPPNNNNSPEGKVVNEKLDRGEGCLHGVIFTAVLFESLVWNPAMIV